MSIITASMAVLLLTVTVSVAEHLNLTMLTKRDEVKKMSYSEDVINIQSDDMVICSKLIEED